jgi:hypothetical protein
MIFIVFFSPENRVPYAPNTAYEMGDRPYQTALHKQTLYNLYTESVIKYDA